MNDRRRALTLGGLLALFLAVGQDRNSLFVIPEAPAATAVAPAERVFTAVITKNHPFVKIASRRKAEKPAARPERGERLREKGEAFGGRKAEQPSEYAQKKAKAVKVEQVAAQ